MPADALAAPPLGRESCSCPRANDQPFIFSKRIDQSPHKHGSRIVSAGALAGCRHNASPALRDDPFNHGDCYDIAPESVPLRHDQTLATLEGSDSLKQCRTVFNAERS
jgi:hypothetical protein